MLGDRSVLYKYLNPNAVVITTEGEEPSTSQQKGRTVDHVRGLSITCINAFLTLYSTLPHSQF